MTPPVPPAIHVGCSGWSYDDWRQTVYAGAPPARWLTLYAELFDTVEVNSSFYRLPTRATARRWAESTPEGFVFALKASRYLTHVRRLRGIREGVQRLYAAVEPLVSAGKLGPVLWQLPPSFERDDDRLREALDALPGGRHCFEFRHASWFAEPVLRLLEDREVALVMAHDGRRRDPISKQATPVGPWAYVRFHYGSRGRRGNYSAAEIEAWATRIDSWNAETWVYFNNDWEAFAVRNAAALRSSLRGRRGESAAAVGYGSGVSSDA
jgi:uncharacterized protein YecE (DUF72 family)